MAEGVERAERVEEEVGDTVSVGEALEPLEGVERGEGLGVGEERELGVEAEEAVPVGLPPPGREGVVVALGEGERVPVAVRVAEEVEETLLVAAALVLVLAE